MATSRTTVQNEWWWYTGDNKSLTSQRFTLLPHLGGLTQRCHVYIFNYNKASNVCLTLREAGKKMEKKNSSV